MDIDINTETLILPKINKKAAFNKLSDFEIKSFMEEREILVNEIFKESDIKSSF